MEWQKLDIEYKTSPKDAENLAFKDQEFGWASKYYETSLRRGDFSTRIAWSK